MYGHVLLFILLDIINMSLLFLINILSYHYINLVHYKQSYHHVILKNKQNRQKPALNRSLIPQKRINSILFLPLLKDHRFIQNLEKDGQEWLRRESAIRNTFTQESTKKTTENLNMQQSREPTGVQGTSDPKL